MQNLIYSVLAIIAIVFVVGIFFRRRIYKEVDQLEEWKNDILNREIPNEIGRVKSLQMSGETEEKFELWRNDWDEIVGVILPDIEEQLFDIEELASKYRFNKSKQLISLTKQRLEGIEENLTLMIEDIERLVNSANESRIESGGVRSQLEELETSLFQKRAVLGGSILTFDSRFEDLKSQISTFDELMGEGSYLQAKDLLERIKVNLDLLTMQSEKVPKLLVQIYTTIPSELSDLSDGISEMKELGYYLEPFSLESRMEILEKQMNQLEELAIALECEQVEETLLAMTDQIEKIYEVLETEAKAKQEVLEIIPSLTETLINTEEQLTLLIDETSHVQLSYRIADEELALQEKIRKKLGELGKQLQVIVDVTEKENQTFTSIFDMVTEWNDEVNHLATEIEQGKLKLQALREDELQAKETIVQLRRAMLDSKRSLQQSNIPGLPDRMIEQLRTGDRKIIEAAELLDLVPLEMGRVNILVAETLTIIRDNEVMIEETIEKARLAERVIQYGNRYRSRSHEVQIGLLQAEQLFRDSEYDEAIESAVRAVEPYEENIVERVSSAHMIS
ncbi:septation ring formation regulator EzrA [Bacillus solitudinis]|uniref:septation ring formation regulator EzrA n=1 Tax=Bacillus solitudinis TaxID=2014074 RepID=UPI000C2469DF|nr:septation ring formation regulator EzrA [Bacillus solitudinis]